MTNAELIAKIKAEIEKLIERYSSVKANGVLQEGYKGGRLIGYEDVLNILKRIQEESEKSIGLEEEINKFRTIFKNECDPCIIGEIANHFAQWGYLRAAEKYNEIEYNRQRAEESEKPIDGLEEEIIKCWQEWISPSNKQNVEGVLPLSEFAYYARHFAKWGAEHLASVGKTSSGSSEIPNDLEEAAEDFGKRQGLELRPFANKFFIAGAKWDREQMMKGEIEAEYGHFSNASKTILPSGKLNIKEGDKVKVIIVKEDEK